jgi:hypothetical protein
MSTGFALWRKNSRGIDWGSLALDADGTVHLNTVEGSATVRLEPDSAPYVDAYVRDDWLCLLGGADRHLVLGHRQPVELSVAGELQRIGRKSEGFDFETHSVRFHDRPGHNQCVLAWELGLALLDPDLGLVWVFEHHDVNQRLLKITETTVELRGLYQTISVSLHDGAADVHAFREPVHDDGGETLAHWMRGIGR